MITLDVLESNTPEDLCLPEAQLATLERELSQRFPEHIGRIEIRGVSDQEIARLNRMYRGKDVVTDVLSFSYLNDLQPVASPPAMGEREGADGQKLLGEVVVSIAQAKRQAQGDLELELVDLLVHGVLHVLGYDHETPQDAQAMFPLQDTLVSAIL